MFPALAGRACVRILSRQILLPAWRVGRVAAKADFLSARSHPGPVPARLYNDIPSLSRGKRLERTSGPDRLSAGHASLKFTIDYKGGVSYLRMI